MEISALFLNVTAVGPALAGGKWDVPIAKSQSREALQTKPEADGRQIRSIKDQEDGCHTAYAVGSKEG
ncbi:PepSY domain-containing protein [Mesorhizobium huakuii]|uniref:PepSY domain-containing protein n=1 Tax=Mesorhizobium huakuii TaxID=28104 RepID=A0A7G6T5G9_9HYPH|nr:PepSY domain-containing protein [Mesorhizobium huakuii]QND62001.1 PepSY domain-containing protein [Mesorhizobium huakuii]QND69372.1 PepSY domain-containing protein [Mesorhizobium loti]